MKDIINNIKYNALFSKVTESELEELLKHLNYSIEKYDKGTVIAQEDDNCSAIGLVLEGRVNIEKIYPSGKGIVMKKLSCGDVFGEALIFSKTTTYPATVMADSNCAVGYLNKAELIKLFSLNDTILENFMMLLSDKVVMLNNKIKSISLKNVRQKVVDYILQEYIVQKQLVISLKMNKEEIASFIGIPRPSLSRELSKLRDEEIIKLLISRTSLNPLELVIKPEYDSSDLYLDLMENHQKELLEYARATDAFALMVTYLKMLNDYFLAKSPDKKKLKFPNGNMGIYAVRESFNWTDEKALIDFIMEESQKSEYQESDEFSGLLKYKAELNTDAIKSRLVFDEDGNPYINGVLIPYVDHVEKSEAFNVK